MKNEIVQNPYGKNADEKETRSKEIKGEIKRG